MMHSDTRTSVLWTSLHVAIILSSAVIVLYPPILHFSTFLIPCCLVLMPVYFVLLLRHLKAEGTGDASLTALHAQAKRGRRLTTSALEWAAAIALLLSAIYMMRGWP